MALDPQHVEQPISNHFVDLLPFVRSSVVSVHACGQKVSASLGAGFHWRTPGGVLIGAGFGGRQHGFRPANASDRVDYVIETIRG
ncbi:MAG: hypothetical protein U0990_00425 [Candidatus Nanopelagicales bacterium]|nr:hypothetical protein [Candidatus Nanopelagicales bacterium]MDZ4248539.1 hypothetical protein [Candidatus Nanopelagicales bacterium]